MSQTVFIDTSFFLAIVNPRDKYNALAQEASALLVEANFVTSEAVLMEVGNALARVPNRPLAVSTIDQIRSHPKTNIISIDSALFDEAYNLFRSRPDKNWGLVDCSSFVLMKQHNIQDVLSADHHFSQAGFNLLIS